MKAPSQTPATERMLVTRIVLALGLALLLLVGAWSDSHGDGDAGSTLCVAVGVSPSAGEAHHDVAQASDIAADAGALGACGIVVFLLVALLLRLMSRRPVLTTGRAVATSVPRRAGPVRLLPALTLTQLSLSRT